MASLFLLIAALVLNRGGVGPLVDPHEPGAPWVVALTLAGTIGLALLAVVPQLRTRWRPRAGAHSAWSRSARRTRWVGTLSCAWLAFCILGLGWLDVIRSAIGDRILLDEALAIAPAIVAMSIAWWWHSAFAMPEAGTQARAAFVFTQMRIHWPLLLAPVALVLASQEIVERLVPRASASSEWIAFGAALLALFLSPAVVIPLLSTSPLPPRPELVEPMRRLFDRPGTRVRAVRLWRTGGTLMNGVALGVLPWCRWVLLTDALVSNLHPDETLAVAAHEAGHIRRHHAAWLAASLVGGVGGAGLGVQALLDWSAPFVPHSPWVEPIAIAVVVVVAVLFFGAVSRTCERQADADSVRSLSAGNRIDPQAVASMRRALAVVAFSNGIPPKRPSFRHGSIASRRRRLESIAGLPKSALPIDRAMTLVQVLIVAALLVTVASLLLERPADDDSARMIRHEESRR